MFYYAGIYNLNMSLVSRDTIKMMASAEKESNCAIFLNGNFGMTICAPKEVNNCLSSPEFSQNKSNDIVVIFEGRLDNVFQLLKFLPQTFQKSSYSFADIIGGLYAVCGEEAFAKLKGIFAFALCDKQKNRFFLCRDKVGIKPLYYYIKNNRLVFGTSIKAVLCHPDIKKEINLERIYNYFMMAGFNLGQDTEYRDIYNILPGNILRLQDGVISRKELVCAEEYYLETESEQSVSLKFFEIIQQSIERCSKLNSKAAIALSGGLDSHAILAVCAQNKNMQLDTGTVNFETLSQAKIQDYQIARQRSKQYSTQHHELSLDAHLFLKEIRQIFSTTDRLFSFDFFNNVYILKWIVSFNKMVFTGDGTEEQLGSYSYTWYAYYADIFLKNQQEISVDIYNNFLEKVFMHRTGWYPGRDGSMELFSKETQAMLKDYDPTAVRAQGLRTSANINLLRDSDTFLPSLLNKCFDIDFKYFFCPNKLLMTDLISRNYSIEVAMPFLDSEFVSFAAQIPGEFKCKGFEKNQTKYIFREALSSLVGKENAFANFKSGSDIPFNEWLVAPEFEKFVRDILHPYRIRKSGLINEEYVVKILDSHYADKTLFRKEKSHLLYKRGVDQGELILKLLGFQLWWEQNFA